MLTVQSRCAVSTVTVQPPPAMLTVQLPHAMLTV